MINRSTAKYAIKKIVPSFVFSTILFLWQTLFLRIVEYVDTLRLKKFTNITCKTLTHGTRKFSLFISPENGFIDNYIFLYGVYESFILDIINTHLHKGMTFVDIGANIGQHSMYAASIVGNKGSVYAFEPIPRIYKQLLSSSKENNFQHILHAKNIALGEKESKETLYISQKNIGGSSLVNQEETNENITVIIKNGDTELKQLAHIDMIKIDVEGYEYEVLTGIEQTLQKHHPKILIEFSGYFYDTHTKDHGAKIISLLKQIGYSLYDIEDSMKEVSNISTFLNRFTQKNKQTNLLCVVV
ncbi:MAG: FkbM family methyltransferase [Candidatus Pacebacteria bacterium]|nr:FkbM family methyltransferase [Candidatus Paceibacterota bacterium]MBP9866844.1 FkbM family methyltransferase [Candidatus Paceibacterota bacterium]